MATLLIVKKMTDKQVQDWLRNVGRENVDTLTMAMVGAEQDAISVIIRNMSRVAGHVLLKNIEELRKGSLNQQLVNKSAEIVEKMV